MKNADGTSVTIPKPKKALKMDHDSIVSRGKTIYDKQCALCHGIEGKGRACPTLIGISKKLTQEEIINIVLYGVKGKMMPIFKDLLTDQEIADVVYYISNSWGNSEKSLIDAETVKALRGK